MAVNAFHNDFSSGLNIAPSTTMKALCMYRDATSGALSPSLKSTTLSVPKAAPDSLLVKILAAAINPSDVLNSNDAFTYTTFPRVPERDFSGVVVAGPDGVVGKAVFGSSGRSISFTIDGTHAEYCLIPISAAAPKPSNLTFAQAASIGVTWSTAHIILDRAYTQPTDTVLILGATGRVGDAATQLARARGCKVITAARRETADINLVNDPELVGLKVLTKGRGADIVVDTVGDPVLMKAAIAALAVRGRILYIAAPRTGSVDFVFDMKALYRAEKSIVGCNSLQYDAGEIGDILRKLAPGFEEGIYKAVPDDDLVKVGFGEEALEAYAKVKQSSGLKYILSNKWPT
jgi:NADPH:quinone reductase